MLQTDGIYLSKGVLGFLVSEQFVGSIIIYKLLKLLHWVGEYTFIFKPDKNSLFNNIIFKYST